MNATSLLVPLYRRGYQVSADLVMTAGLVVVTWLTVFLPIVRDTPLRVPFGVLLVLVLPGYAVLSALFPGVDRSATAPRTSNRGQLDGADRVLLAVALSLALTVVVGLSLSVTPWGFTVVPTTLALGVVTLACCLVGAARRARLFPQDRAPSLLSGVFDHISVAFSAVPRRTRLLNVLIVCGVVVAAGSIAYAAAVPNPTAPFSEFYVLSDSGAADPTTQGYDLTPGEDTTLRVGIVNNERTTVDYTVVVVAQQVAVEDGTERVVAQTELDRFSYRIVPGKTREFDHTVAAETEIGASQRVAYLLYKRTPPAFPAADTAYRHLFVTVGS
jgi:uncharacterized membrane protein